ncbi:MAG: T9SS type A sorting domain-containing protein [Bacteroidales bacterium]
MQKKSTILLFILSLILSIGVNAQTFTETYRNDNFKVKEFTGDMPVIYIINNKDDDTIWVSYLDVLNPANSRIISLTKDLNIISNSLINNPTSIQKIVEHKINDKFYGLHYTNNNLDTLQFRCIDRNGNVLIDKSLWIKNSEDTLWINTMQGFKYRRLSNNNFFLIANAQYPSTQDQSNTINYCSDALKLIIFDTLGNILNTKTYPLKSEVTETRICEVGEHLLLEKFAVISPTEYFGYRGISYINKETLEIEDSIPHGPFIDTLPNGIIRGSHHLYNIIAINDTTFAGLFQGPDYIKIHIFNKNNKEIIHQIEPITSSDINTQRNYDIYYDRFVFNNTDSIYTHYEDDESLVLLNFSATGNINFQYKFLFPSDYEKSNHVRGMKITEDGEVIISTSSFITPPYGRAAWLIKFNPEGLIGLTNIQTGETETIKVYPNPARDYINIDIESTNFKQSDIELFDMQGKLVKKAKLKSKQGNRIDVSNLNAGAYTYNVSLNGKTISGKIIVGK